MHERSLPASPNWYCSRCSDVNGSGLLGVGAKNIIYLIDVTASSGSVVGESAGHYIHPGTCHSASLRLKAVSHAGKKVSFCPHHGGVMITAVGLSQDEEIPHYLVGLMKSPVPK